MNLHVQLVGTANSKALDSKKAPKLEAQTIRASESKSTCTMCGRFYHDKDKCPELESKYANKTKSPYVGSAAHSLLVKETASKSIVPITKRKIPEVLPESKNLLTRSSLEARKIGKTIKVT